MTVTASGARGLRRRTRSWSATRIRFLAAALAAMALVPTAPVAADSGRHAGSQKPQPSAAPGAGNGGTSTGASTATQPLVAPSRGQKGRRQGRVATGQDPTAGNAQDRRAVTRTTDSATPTAGAADVTTSDTSGGASFPDDHGNSRRVRAARAGVGAAPAANVATSPTGGMTPVNATPLPLSAAAIMRLHHRAPTPAGPPGPRAAFTPSPTFSPVVQSSLLRARQAPARS